jgi:hypothetical protein
MNMQTRAFLIYIREELYVKELLTLANFFVVLSPILERHSSERHSSEIDEELADSYKAFWQNLSFRKQPDLLGKLWLEIMLCRSVDNFNSYLADVIHSVFKVRPEALRSSEKITIEEVLNCGSLDEFVELWAARKVEALSYGGFFEIKKYLTDRIGIEDDFDERQIASAVEAIATRNIIVHNRGRINERFLKDARRQDLKPRDTIQISREQTFAYCHSLERIVTQIDKLLIQKFGEELFNE